LKLSQALKDSLKELITIAGDGVSEVEVEKRMFGWKLRISKGSAAQAVQIAAPAAAPAVAEPAPASAAEEVAPANEPAGTPIPSPMVGTFYRSPSPDADPFINIGDVVTVGQTVCIIEAMKIMNEIEAEVGGRVTKVLVENGAPVEYNTPLFLVEPS
jgi:acetyl-CoA carboxylase biotin carboxyl carrier protein